MTSPPREIVIMGERSRGGGAALTLLALLSPPALLNAFNNTKSMCVDFSRLLAAFYLDFPLLLPGRDDQRLPTLFAWSELSADEASEYVPLDRIEFASRLPTTFSPKLPAVVLARSGFVLEAILYADHFADRRSALMLRMFGDLSYGLSLTHQYCNDLISDTLSRSVSNAIAGPAHYQQTLAKLEDNIVQSLLELDIITGQSFVAKLETSIVAKMEVLFAQLPLTVHEDYLLVKRAPLYCMPEYDPQPVPSAEEVIYLKLHAYLRLFLHALHRTNRVEVELVATLAALSRFGALHEPSPSPIVPSNTVSPLTRALLLVLRLIYRDEFSVLVKKQTSSIAGAAERYKALLAEEENESDLKPFERFFSLALDDDVRHVTLFIDYLRQNFRAKGSSLPPFENATREVWRNHLLGSSGDVAPIDATDCAWFLSRLSDDVKVDPARFRQMRFVSESWTAYAATSEGGLISLRLHLTPGDLCVPRGDSGELSVQSSRQPKTATARSFPDRNAPSAASQVSLSFRGDADDDETRARKRQDLIAEYAHRKLERKGSLSARSAAPATSRPIYFKNTMREKLREIAVFQRHLEAQLDTEDSFLESLNGEITRDEEVEKYAPMNYSRPNERMAWMGTAAPAAPEIKQHRQSRQPRSARTPRKAWGLDELKDDDREPHKLITGGYRSRAEARRELEKTIQVDLSRLNTNLERISQYLEGPIDEHSRASSSNSTASTSMSAAGRGKKKDEQEPPVDGIFHYEQKAPGVPAIEKLDLRALTPPPDVGRRRGNPVEDPSTDSATAAGRRPVAKSERTVGRLPGWVKLVPLTAERPWKPLVHPSKTTKKPAPSPSSTKLHSPPSKLPIALRADRACQAEAVESRSFVRELSPERVQSLIQSFL